MVSRRNFLKGAAMGSLAVPTMLASPFGFAGDESRLGSKALVYVLLDGGNDAAQMVIPTSEINYQEYQSIRPEIALLKEELHAIPAKGLDRYGREVTLGLHPQMSALAKVFNDLDATVVVNSGVLREPLTKLEAETEGYRLPPFLFSHNSQRSEWAKGAVGQSLTTGWAGRMMDVIHTSTGTAISPLFSHAGDAQLLRASALNQNIIRGENIAKLNASKTMLPHMDDYFNSASGDAFDNTLLNIGKDSIHVAGALIDTINNIDDAEDVPLYPDTMLGTQFRITSRLIRQSAELGHGRQVFFLRLGGFDTHANQAEVLDENYLQLSEAMAAFNDHLKTLGLHNDVITVTMSDFGRCLHSNGTGTDHGWGGHQILMGGDIDGAQFVGTFPEYKIDGLDVYERGRLLPTTAADQVNISLAKWFGLTSEAAINHVFPNHKNFAAISVTKAV
ncbi:hypothetical protein BIY21_14880 [Vibrio ponticus]|uniref:DUF1501 domain-containing protein n=1 Tax=Vibrio ponticus TaxID=265668 RepID=A0A3N3E1G0_9VIBR|nr:DUF1501 domain-containing protein [Vibrio ponticus]OLQ89718.1 hypothetical protein BIY21_14880 [Vibrio ponticus]ROV60348.1 DUF1501 domain-containing protein [Vibrio ponticus]